MFGSEGKKKKAIAYYRHSAEDKQENSVPLQREQTQSFADKHGIDIIHEEADEGKSGLSSSRPGFERLFEEWVLNPDAEKVDFILVLDVTRWGRFQDPDEAAYWEMQCKKRGIRVIYITRGFPKEEEKLLSSLETSIGRYMAAEYSRQLSEKVWHGSIKVAEQGFSAGGTAPYGYQRVLLDEHHKRIGVLKLGEHKVIANQRVTFEPAEDETPAVVRLIFDSFVNYWIPMEEIAAMLNEEKIPSSSHKKWDYSKVLRILTNETYTGTRVYNKTWGRLKQKKRKNPRDEWVRSPGAFPGLIDYELFKKAQEHIYWVVPYRWRYGINKITIAKNMLRTYVEELIADFEPDQKYTILHNLPFTYGLIYYKDGIGKRCFRINEAMHKHTEVIAISIDMFTKNKIDTVFSIPINNFGIGNYIVFDDNDPFISQFKISEEDTRQKLMELCSLIVQ